MARPLTADQTLAAMRKFNVPVQLWPGWNGRGRPGSFSNVNGVIIHHTASTDPGTNNYLKFLFENGRSDLPAPLCHSAGKADGTIVLGATGRANHAGKGSSLTLNKVINENGGGGEFRPGPDDIDGNARYYGIEICYRGVDGHRPTAAQVESAARWAAALCWAHGWSAMAVIGHREHTRTKIDPGYIEMGQFRNRVQELLNAGGVADKPKYDTRFRDVPKTHTFYKEIEWLAVKGITSGYKDADGFWSYRPGSPVTREQLATFLYRYTNQRGFKDVSKSHPRFAEITWMAGGTKLSTGFDDGTFRPDAVLTRDTLAAFLYRLAGSPKFDLPNEPTFTDVDSKTTFHKEIEWMVSKGITTGYVERDGSKTFRPTAPVLREQFAAFLYRYDKA